MARHRETGTGLAGDPDAERDDDALHARLESLSRSLDAGKTASAESEGSPAGGDRSLATAMGLGVRVLTEFVAGIVVGGLIGWGLDRWLHTSPALLLVFLGLGTAAGFWNVYKIAMKPTGSRPS